MIVEKLSDLGVEPERAVIINVSTKAVSTLALMAALRYAEMPVLVIDCESNDGSYEYFCTLQERHDFDLITAPLKPHGLTLDWLFKDMLAEKALLIDSDLEILNSGIVSYVKEQIKAPTVFGSGFVEGPAWSNEPQFRGTERYGAYFQERPWIPFAFLKTEPAREAVNDGVSFSDTYAFNEYARLPLIPYLRARARIARKLTPWGPSFLRKTYFGLRPSVVYYDTGGRIYEHLKNEKQMGFVGLPESTHDQYVKHFFGVTRKLLDPNDLLNGGGMATIMDYVASRLSEDYGIEL